VSESNGVVGQIIARDYDDSPVPFTGRVLGQVDRSWSPPCSPQQAIAVSPRSVTDTESERRHRPEFRLKLPPVGRASIPDQRRLPPALEGKAFAIGDNSVNGTLIQLKLKGCHRDHDTPENESLRRGNIINFDIRLPNCLADEHFNLYPVNWWIIRRREFHDIQELSDIMRVVLFSKEELQDALAHQFGNRRFIVIPSWLAIVELPSKFVSQFHLMQNHRPQKLADVGTRLGPRLRP
jgi:hypothetical protein